MTCSHDDGASHTATALPIEFPAPNLEVLVRLIAAAKRAAAGKTRKRTAVPTAGPSNGERSAKRTVFAARPRITSSVPPTKSTGAFPGGVRLSGAGDVRIGLPRCRGSPMPAVTGPGGPRMLPDRPDFDLQPQAPATPASHFQETT